ncbi:MAG: hypothetical protein K0U12_04480 [Gammaproteobacteria bacterium]|nr:hypothetical protein [Gammaproteobacteria bacterium]
MREPPLKRRKTAETFLNKLGKKTATNGEVVAMELVEQKALATAATSNFISGKEYRKKMPAVAREKSKSSRHKGNLNALRYPPEEGSFCFTAPKPETPERAKRHKRLKEVVKENSAAYTSPTKLKITPQEKQSPKQIISPGKTAKERVCKIEFSFNGENSWIPFHFFADPQLKDREFYKHPTVAAPAKSQMTKIQAAHNKLTYKEIKPCEVSNKDMRQSFKKSYAHSLHGGFANAPTNALAQHFLTTILKDPNYPAGLKRHAAFEYNHIFPSARGGAAVIMARTEDDLALREQALGSRDITQNQAKEKCGFLGTAACNSVHKTAEDALTTVMKKLTSIMFKACVELKPNTPFGERQTSTWCNENIAIRFTAYGMCTTPPTKELAKVIAALFKYAFEQAQQKESTKDNNSESLNNLSGHPRKKNGKIKYCRRLFSTPKKSDPDPTPKLKLSPKN